jgi:hypothetical protein
MSERFGTLRALLQQAPSEHVWKELCEELALWGEEERERVALPYALDHLDRWPDEVERWAHTNDPAWQQHIANSIAPYDEEWLAEVAQGPRASRVRHLKLESKILTHAATPEMVARLDGLVSVELLEGWRGKRAKAVGALALARRPWPPTLRSLKLEIRGNVGMDGGVEFARSIVRNATFSGLTTLALHVAFGVKGAELIAQSQHLRRVSCLSLDYTHITSEGIAKLVDCGVIGRLEQLSLRCNQLDDVAVETLADSGQLGGLRVLDLANNQIGDAGLIALIERGGLDRLEVLRIANNQIRDAGAAALANSPLLCASKPDRSRNGEFQGLADNNIGRTGLLALLRSPHLDALEELELYGNPLTHEDILAIAAAPELARLRGVLLVSVTDGREETWQALIDSPYASEPTREKATRVLEYRRMRERQGW